MRILVTTDGSGHSLLALPHAARLADATGSRLLLTRVLDKRLDLGNELTPTVAQAAKAVAARWESELRANAAVIDSGAEPSVFVMARREDKPTAILRASQELRASVLVMSTRGAGIVRHALLGSVSMEMLGRSEVPLMLAGANIQPPVNEGPYHILVTTDGSEASEGVWPVLRQVFRGVTTVSVLVTVLQVFTPRDAEQPDHLASVDAEWQLSQFLKLAPERLNTGAVARKAGPGEKVDAVILSAAQELGVDAIWMATQGHSIRKRVLLGSTALGVLNQSPVPVTLIRATVGKK